MYEIDTKRNKNSTRDEQQNRLKREKLIQKKQDQLAGSGNVRYKAESEKQNPIVQKVLRPIRQTGANCGLFAMAMALEELTGERGELIASRMENFARERGYTAIGEMFNAENLVKAGQEFCNQFFPQSGIRISLLNFESEDEMKTIFNVAKEKEKYVLFPYYSRRAIPFTDYGVVPGENMETAHWSVIEKRKREGESEEQIHILEGHSRIFDGPENSYLNEDRYKELFASHMSLNNELIWTNFWKKQDEALHSMNEQLKHATRLMDKVVDRGTKAEKRLLGLEAEEENLEVKRRKLEDNEKEWEEYQKEFEKREWKFREQGQLVILNAMQNHMLESPYYEAYMEQLQAAGPEYEAYIQQMTGAKHYYEECKRELEVTRQECQRYKQKIEKLQKEMEKQKEYLGKETKELEEQKTNQTQWYEKAVKYYQELSAEKQKIENYLIRIKRNRVRFFNSPRILYNQTDIIGRGEGGNITERVNLRNRMILIEK